MDSFRTAAERFYRRLVRLYPGEFRAEFGEEMSLLFKDRSREERLVPLVFEVLVDTARTAPKEHVHMWSQDLRYAWRAMRHNPGFTLVAAGSLAIGIGASAAVFSMADALLLRPLPVPRPSEVVVFRNSAEISSWGSQFRSVSYPDYRDLRGAVRSLSGLAAFDDFSAALSTDSRSEPQLTLGTLVSGDFFSVLGVEPALGRGFRLDEEATTGGARVAVLSHAAWKAQFGGDLSVLGRSVRVNGTDLTVVGVAPERFTGMDLMVRTSFYVPFSVAPALLGPDGEARLTRRDRRGLTVEGRLRPGTSLAQADAEVEALARNLAAAYPDTNKNQALNLRTQLQARIESSPPDAAIMAMLLTLVALVLLIACANVAGLLLSRSGSRAREIAVRLAVGASRARLVRQLLTESLLLALLGGLMGLAFAALGVHFFSSIPMPTDIPVVLDVKLDRRVLIFSLAASVISACVFGLVPALRATRNDLVSSLKAGEAGLSGLGRILGRKALVVSQVALAVVLLAAATSLFRGIEKNLTGDPGFRTTGLLTASFDPSVRRYTPEQTRAFYRELLERARLLPGVDAAALTRAIPMSNGQALVSFTPEGYTLPEGRENLTSLGNIVDATYFDTFGVAIVRGRAFRETDGPEAPRVAIVNEEMAGRYWPGGDAVGKRVRLDGTEGPFAEIVGVARNHRYVWTGEAPTEYMYLPFLQEERSRMSILLLTEGDPLTFAAPLRTLAASVGPGVPMNSVRSMADHYGARAVRLPRMIVTTVASMGLSGLLLALVGLYGLMAYSVSRRTREIGIRMAIGAERSAVVGMLLRHGLALTLPGIAIGLVGTLFTSRLLAAAVSGVSPTDPAALIAIPLGLMTVTLLATLVPALRAARLDPREALRQE
jgi:putative ABC transport system permease protein